MRLAYEMERTLPYGERSSIKMIRYSPEYQEEYKRVYNECFREMRRALNIRPYDYIRDDSFFETEMDMVYLLTDEGEIVGSVKIKNNEIDDLIVNIKYQGLGYGRQILLWALENIHTDKAVLHVAEWNKKAVSLYQKAGFEIIKTIEF